MGSDRLGIDFGTSNTAAAVMVDAKPYIIPLEAGAETLPTAVFLDFSQRQTLYGSAAISALIDGREGRFMRALKSVLGTPLMHEKRQFMQERLTLVEITARFLARVKSQAETHCRRPFPRALSGRPVQFHSANPDRNARALDDLHACYLAAGFEDVAFLPEPEAAALASGPLSGGVGLIVDIGGGTSDFTVFEQVSGKTKIIASHGVRIGGTDFDKALSLAHVMPLFGKGSLIRAEIGPKTHPAPAKIFNELATWEKIPFLYSGEVTRDVARMAKLAQEPDKLARLSEVLDMHLGHDVAFAVERGKIGANRDGGVGRVDLSVVQRGLGAMIAPVDLQAGLGGFAADIRAAAATTLAMADCPPDAISRVVLVGGSSLLRVVSDAVATLLPNAEMAYGNAFTAIVDGLAIAAAD